MNRYSTREAAKKLRLHLATLQRYMAEGKVPAPPVQDLGGNKFRMWSDDDIDRVREILPKIANGRKTRYQKLREKQKAQAGVPVPHKKRKSSKKK